MELRRYIATIARRSLLIVLTTAMAAIAAWLTAPTATLYSTEATVYVGTRQFLASPTGLSNDTLVGLERVINTFARMVDSVPVASEALAQIEVSRSAIGLVGATEAAPVPGTQLLAIRVTDADPAAAQAMANGLADALTKTVQEFEPSAVAGEGSLPILPAYVFERARLPVAPQPVGTLRRVILGTLFGLVIGLAAAFLLEYLDLTVKGPEDAESRIDLPVLGLIPLYQRPPSGPSDRG